MNRTHSNTSKESASPIRRVVSVQIMADYSVVTVLPDYTSTQFQHRNFFGATTRINTGRLSFNVLSLSTHETFVTTYGKHLTTSKKRNVFCRPTHFLKPANFVIPASSNKQDSFRKRSHRENCEKS